MFAPRKPIVPLLAVLLVAIVSLSAVHHSHPQQIHAQSAKGKAEERKQPATRPERQKPLDIAKHPIPTIKLRPIAEHVAAVKLSDDHLIKTDADHDLTDEELWATSAMIHLMVRAAFEHQTETGLFLQAKHGGTLSRTISPNVADMSCVSSSSNLVRVNHVRILLAMLRFGVSPTEPRMVLAYEQHNKQLDLVLADWRKDKRPENIGEMSTPRLLGLSLKLIHEWNRGRVGSDGGKVTARNPMGLSKKTTQLVEELLEAVDSLCIRGGTSIQGWDMKHGSVGSTPPFVTVTATVLEGLCAAQSMGFQIKDPRFLHATIARLVRFQSHTNHGDTVSFVLKKQTSSRVGTTREESTIANPRGWRRGMDMVVDGGVAPAGSRLGRTDRQRDHANTVCTAGGLACLLLAREVLQGAKLNPYKETKQAAVEKSIWDAMGYLHRNLGYEFERYSGHWDTYEHSGDDRDSREEVVHVSITDIGTVHDALCFTGNLAVGETPWYRAMTKQMVREWLPEQAAEAARIKSQHIEGGGAQDDPALKQKLLEYWREVSKGTPSELIKYGVMNNSKSGNILLVLHGINFPPPPATPETTGGSKPAEAPPAPDKPGGSKAPGE